MIVFRKIRYKNLLSTGNQFTEIDLNRHATTLIIGDNGAGKSTVIDALSLGLFGKPFRKINKNQLVNTITRKEAVVEIDLTSGAKFYKIVRGIKPNIFELWEDGVLINQDAGTTDYQEYLEKHVIKANHKSFFQIVVLGSANYVPFMQLPTGQRREIIEELLDLQIFTGMNKVLKGKLEIVNEDLAKLDTDQQVVETKIKMIKKHREQVQADTDSLVAEKMVRISDVEASLVDVEKDLIKVKNSLALTEGELAAIPDRTSKINMFNQLEGELKAKVARHVKDSKFLTDHANCPTCAQEIAPEFKAQHVAEHDAKITELNTALADLVDKRSKAEELQKARKTGLVEQQKLQTSMLLLKQQVDGKKSTIAGLNADIVKLQTRSVVSTSDEPIEDHEAKLVTIAARVEEQTNVKAVMLQAVGMLKDGGIKSQIVKQYVPIINKVINKYLSALDFFVDFNLDESFSETIRSRYRDDFSYASFSEGEKMLLDLAILFTWRAVSKLRNSINTNLLIMDEVFDGSLDANKSDEFMKMLKTVAEGMNVFIISHRSDAMVDKFETNIKFVKTANFSRIAEDA